MHGKAWTFARLVIPVEFKLIAFGVSIGVLIGLVGLRTENPGGSHRLGACRFGVTVLGVLAGHQTLAADVAGFPALVGISDETTRSFGAANWRRLPRISRTDPDV